MENSDLQSEVQAKTQFITQLQHELRTPLNTILGYTQILKRAENLDDTQREQLELMHCAGEQLLKHINDFLDIGRIRVENKETKEMVLDLAAQQESSLPRPRRYDDLVYLANCGDMTGLKQWIVDFESACDDDRYKDFTRMLGELADNYQTARICTMLDAMWPEPSLRLIKTGMID